jgi:hypothetical protein
LLVGAQTRQVRINCVVVIFRINRLPIFAPTVTELTADAYSDCKSICFDNQDGSVHVAPDYSVHSDHVALITLFDNQDGYVHVAPDHSVHSDHVAMVTLFDNQDGSVHVAPEHSGQSVHLWTQHDV